MEKLLKFEMASQSSALSMYFYFVNLVQEHFSIAHKMTFPDHKLPCTIVCIKFYSFKELFDGETLQ